METGESGGGQWDPGSFRDRTSRVFHGEGKVFRSLSARALADWEQLHAAGWFEALQTAGKVVRTSRVDTVASDERPRGAGGATLRTEAPEPEPAAVEPRWVATLTHETIPFVSYAYE